MAGACTDYYEDQLLSKLITDAATVGLLTALPGDTGTGGSPTTGTEVSTSGTGYARMALTAADWVKAASGTTQQITYNAAIQFAQATGAWGTVVGWCLFDATGHQLWYGAISPTQAITNGQQPSLAANTIVCSLD